MTVAAFNATVWARSIQENLNKQHVHADVMNRNYEGEVKMGATVKINSIGRITIKTYSRNAGAGGTAASPTIAGIERPEILNSSALFLDITELKYFNFEIDDVDRWQQTPKLMASATKEASYALKNEIDLFCNSTLQTGVAGTTDGTGNRLAARTIGTEAGDDDAYELLVDLKVKLKENDVDDEDLWCIVPPWFKGMLEKDVRFTNYGTSANRATLENGRIGRAAGFEILESNNISGATSGTLAVAGGVYTVLAGSKMAATFAEQLQEVIGFKPHDGFNDALRALHVYGAKVCRPYALSSCAVTAA